MSNTLAQIVAKLETLAPLALAESWDNAGLLLPGDGRAIACALLAIDLTRAVADEAITRGADLVVSYHPPIFGGLKRLRREVPSEAVVLALIEAGVAVHSPHTALDAARGGMNDWLAGLIGAGELAPLVPSPPSLARPSEGAGRRLALTEPATLDAIAGRVAASIGAPWLRVAASAKHASGAPIASAAVCAGAGGALFEKLAPGSVDLLLTGELRHHDVLARVESGTSVLLAEHTGSERGYLPTLRRSLAAACPEVEWMIAERDREPLALVAGTEPAR